MALLVTVGIILEFMACFFVSLCVFLEMKNTAYRPAYRRNTISRKNTLTRNTSAQDELTKSLKRSAEPPKPKERKNKKRAKDSYTDTRPWLK